MIPSETLINKWNALKEKNDLGKLSKILKVNKQNACRIRNGGNTTLSNIAKITKFYDKREIERNKYATQPLDQD